MGVDPMCTPNIAMIAATRGFVGYILSAGRADVKRRREIQRS